MIKQSKIVPVMEPSTTIEIGSYVYIDNLDDDMHNKKGIFKGHFKHVDGEMRSLIILEENDKNFYTLPKTLQKI
tara:strand:+ start:46 stop:267 length:222 start_codon:yes stop_codon:yes gene_type:complete